MITKLEENFKAGSNTTLANFQFHALTQGHDESFETFSIRVKHEARKCDLTCREAACTVKSTLIRDRIIVGTNYDEIRQHALKNQWGLDDLIKNGRRIESAKLGAQRLNEGSSAEVRRTKQPGKYSQKKYKNQDFFKKQHFKNQVIIPKCETCSNKNCKGESKCPGTKVKCFTCGKKGHFQNSQACKGSNKDKIKRKANRVEDSDNESESSVTEDSDSKSDNSDPGSDYEERSSRRIIQVRRVKGTRLKPAVIRHARNLKEEHKKDRYRVNVIIKEQETEVFADTGADICLMSKANAKKLSLPLRKTRMKIHPYGSKRLKCCGAYVGTVMHSGNVANTIFYVVEKPVETLISGRVAEDLNILTYNRKTRGSKINKVEVDPYEVNIDKKYPGLFEGLGRLKDYEVNYHIDKEVQPVVQAQRQIPFHLQCKFLKTIHEMEEAGAIVEHHGPTKWVSNPVLTLRKMMEQSESLLT